MEVLKIQTVVGVHKNSQNLGVITKTLVSERDI